MASMKASKLTYADLQRLPDDGLRHELIDGELIVSPAPAPLHQRVVLRLGILLDRVCPQGMEVFVAPLDWVAGDRDVYEPDVLLCRREDLTDRFLAHPPALAIEVLSPSNRAYDLVRKRSVYARAGLEHYWVVDPDKPSVTFMRLRDGVLVEADGVVGDDSHTVGEPLKATICPRELVSG